MLLLTREVGVIDFGAEKGNVLAAVIDAVSGCFVEVQKLEKSD